MATIPINTVVSSQGGVLRLSRLFTSGICGLLCRFEWKLTRRRMRELPNRVDSPAPSPAPEGGEVLAAGPARGPDANPASNPKPLSVKDFSMPSRVRCAGLRPPLTAPKIPLLLRPAPWPRTRKGKARLVNFHSKRHWARKDVYNEMGCNRRTPCRLSQLQNDFSELPGITEARFSIAFFPTVKIKI
jgi:hypothetical protein